ncbi:MAG: hypothetical protein JW720_09460 [Sedimentisphaerales bacterium]|nr:hypothetical protein [Sedimentisphaerales bacterium]
MLASIVLIGTVAAYNWFLSPHVAYLEAAHRYGATADEFAGKYRAMSTGIAKQHQRLSELREELSQTKSQVFDSSGAKEFFSCIEVMAESAGCIVSSLTFKPINAQSGGNNLEGFITAQRVKLNILGEYSDLLEMMNEFQNRTELVLIDSISIKLGDSASDILDCEMNIMVYVMQDEEINSDG